MVSASALDERLDQMLRQVGGILKFCKQGLIYDRHNFSCSSTFELDENKVQMYKNPPLKLPLNVFMFLQGFFTAK